MALPPRPVTPALDELDDRRAPLEDDQETGLGDDGGDASLPEDAASWIDEAHDAEDLVAAEPTFDEDEGSALDDSTAEVEDDPLPEGDETRWTDGSEADPAARFDDLDGDDDEGRSSIDDGAEGLEGDSLDPEESQSVALGSDEEGDDLPMGELAEVEGELAELPQGLTALSSHEGQTIEVRPGVVRALGQELRLEASGAVALDDDTLLAWRGGEARFVRIDDGAGLGVLSGVVLAAPDGRGGALVVSAAGALRHVQPSTFALGPVLGTLDGVVALAVLPNVAYVAAGERLFAMALSTGALRPVEAGGAPLALVADARGRLVAVVRRGAGLVVTRYQAGAWQTLGALRGSVVAGVAAVDRGVLALVDGATVWVAEGRSGEHA